MLWKPVVTSGHILISNDNCFVFLIIVHNETEIKNITLYLPF